MRNYNSQLKSLITGAMIASVGGFVYVTSAGGTAKASLTDADGASLSNPLALTNGSFDFNVADSIASVDMYIQSPTGHFSVVKAVKSSGDSSILIDNSLLHTTMVIPVNYADQVADNTATGCGFTQIGSVLPYVALDVDTSDASAVVNLGTDPGDGGDINGFLNAVPFDNTGYVKGTLVNGSATIGALISVQDSGNAGDLIPEQSISHVGKEFTYQFSAGADTASGFFIIPIQLPVSSL